MTETNRHAQWFSDNEQNWDDHTELHMAGNYCDYQRLLEDPTAISIELAQDIERFGDLAGKDVIHLQCHVGTDTIGFARRGASRVIGLDLSEASLAHARSIAERAGADVEFVHANVYDARQAVSGTFDLVYTSIGVLCWLPNIARWAQVIASLLKPGGTFFIRDDHPMFMTIGEDVSDGLKIEAPYFEQDAPMTWDDDSSYVDIPDAPRITHTNKPTSGITPLARSSQLSSTRAW
jgi:2-polyprenyl-3-methyl-5-hydroxy-6-metoxy-1,4-benzoquinol methylase